MSKPKEKIDWADIAVYGFIGSVVCALIGAVTGITLLQLMPVILIIPLLLVMVVAFLGQLYFTGKDIKDDFKKTFAGGRTFGKRSNRRK